MELAGLPPREGREPLVEAETVSAPLLLVFPERGSLLMETRESGNREVAGVLNNIVLRLLAAAPPGRVEFTVMDPVELGQNFAGLMHLADFEERLIDGRIWTQPAQIEERLAALNEHIEKVTQMYLRNEYETIAAYNERAGRIAEKYHFVVIADFPANFTESAARRLLSIAASGARCGVYLLVHWDRRRAAPPGFVGEELAKACVRIEAAGREARLADDPLPAARLALDPPPAPDLANSLLRAFGLASIDANRVEVPFAEIAPKEEERWSGETSTELRVPIGRAGAAKWQYLAIGRDTRQHALVAGKTGSGKSTLFHVIITNLALWCGPEAVEFYLVDFKKGVEFKCYAAHRLPHARVVAIESDREFGLSVLQRVDDELRRRGDLFRRLNVQDLPAYNRAPGAARLPRTLLIIDEFQEFFVEDDAVAQNAGLLLDRLVRQGRAFGIHVLLGSQTLGGAYTIARSTFGQMAIRIALQCNEADAYLIMDEGNPAPRLLSRPGEAIYNNAAGMIEGNSPFQIVWLAEEERDASLRLVSRMAAEAGWRKAPVVFEGNSPADLAENSVLEAMLDTAPGPGPGRAFLGAPNAIKGPTEAVFDRQNGRHLLVVGQRDDAALAILVAAVVSLAARHRPGGARYALLDASPPESRHRAVLETLGAALPEDMALVRPAGVAGVLAAWTAELERRAALETDGGAPYYLLVHGLQRFRALRHEEDFSYSSGAGEAPAPSAQFERLAGEGAALGMHILCTCDTWTNVTRFLGRKALGEFEMRVLFQMSANDSASLIDTTKASELGLHRALFHNAHEGFLEMFRPYALPSEEWIRGAARRMGR